MLRWFRYIALAVILCFCYIITAVKDTTDYLRQPALDAETRLEMGLKPQEQGGQTSPLLAARHIPGRGYYNPQPLLGASSAA